MKIVVINLKGSVERKNFQIRQARHLDIAIDFHEATSIADVSDEKFEALCCTWQRPLRKGEVCCFLSHKSVWEKVLVENQPILILEDDAILSSSIKEVLTQLQKVQNVDRVNLEARIKKKVIARTYQSISDHKLIKVFVDRSGSAGYVLYPSGAKKLLRKYQDQVALADKIDRDDALISYQIEPSAVLPIDYCHHFNICTEDSEAQVSTINIRKRNSETHKFFTVLRCKVRRFTAEARLVKQRFLGLLYGEKRFIKVQKEDYLQFLIYK